MESNYTTLRIHKPIEERVCLSPPLSLCKGPFLPSKVPLRYQKRPTSKHEEEGLSATPNQGHVDKKEFLKTLDDSSGIRRLTKPSPCSDWQAFMNMGNQQGTKIKSNGRGNVESWSPSPKSSKIQKRRKRVEGMVYSGNLQHNTKMSPQVPLKARKTLTVQKPSSPFSIGRRHFEEESLTSSTPTARRKRVIRNEREDRSVLTQELMSAWREKLSDALSGPYSQKDSFILRDNSSSREDSPGADSDTDLSEYDNEIYATFTSHAGAKQRQKYEDEDKSQTKFSQCNFDELMKKAAAQRVMGKIEEVEGIIRRVRRTSVDWIKETCDGRDEPQFVSDKCTGEKVSSRLLPQLKGMQFESVQSWLEDQDRESHEVKHPLVAELHTLSRALSKSLQQALKMEAARTESDASVEVDTLFCGQSHMTSAPLNVPSHPYQVSPIPSPCSSTALDVSPRTSSSMERLSPILSPLLTFSPVSTSVTDQRHSDISESHGVCTDSDEDTFSALGAGGRIHNNPVTGGPNNDERNTSEQWSQSNLRLNEDDLLSSDEALQRQEEIWQQEVEESLSHCRSLFHPSRPKHIDFLRLTAPDDDITDTPSPLPRDLMVSRVKS